MMKKTQANILDPARLSLVVTVSLFADILICEVNLKTESASLEYQEVSIYSQSS